MLPIQPLRRLSNELSVAYDLHLAAYLKVFVKCLSRIHILAWPIYVGIYRFVGLRRSFEQTNDDNINSCLQRSHPLFTSFYNVIEKDVLQTPSWINMK